jgi:hypothetical protein
VAFWNLRACGQDVFPGSGAHADLLEEPLRQWLDEVASAPPLAEGQAPRLPVWLPPEQAETRSPFAPPPLPPRLGAVIDA